MSYSLRGLGVTAAEQAEARRRNEEQGVVNVTVGPGFWDDYLDAALTPRGIPSSEASRVPAVVREVLEANGNEVKKVVWGGGDGLESIRGKVYVKWKPSRPYNAVTYADIARRLFMSAADQFPAGAQLVMHRYRIPGALLAPLRGGSMSDRYVYPEGGSIPASAPEAARRTNVEDLPLEPTPPGPSSTPESDFAGDVAPWILAGVSGVALLGGGYLWYRSRGVRRNRKRTRRTSR